MVRPSSSHPCGHAGLGFDPLREKKAASKNCGEKRLSPP